MLNTGKENSKYGKIGVLMGGCSSERDISLKSGTAVLTALRELGCDVVAVDITSSDNHEIRKIIFENKIDIAFIALHGRIGEDGVIQGILEGLNIPYTGSGIEASRLAINKIMAQSIFKKNGLLVPEHSVLSLYNIDTGESIIDNIKGFPVIIKPACEGSSIGVTVVENKRQLRDAVKTAYEYGKEVLIEEFIYGRELTVGILEGNPLPIIELRPKRRFFDFFAKYNKGITEYIIPAKIESNLYKDIQDTAVRAYELLGCDDFARVDFMLDRHNRYYILEVNTIPGFTETSLLPKAAAEIGINFKQLCLKLVELAYAKKKKK